MANKASLKAVAKEETKGLSDLFEGREQLKKKDRKKFLNRHLTIMDFDVLDYNTSHYAVVVFEEEEQIAYSAGKNLTEIIDAYVGNFDSVSDARAAYRDEDPCIVMLEETETKEKGNTFIRVTVVDGDEEVQ